MSSILSAWGSPCSHQHLACKAKIPGTQSRNMSFGAPITLQVTDAQAEIAHRCLV